MSVVSVQRRGVGVTGAVCKVVDGRLEEVLNTQGHQGVDTGSHRSERWLR